MREDPLIPLPENLRSEANPAAPFVGIAVVLVQKCVIRTALVVKANPAVVCALDWEVVTTCAMMAVPLEVVQAVP